MTRNLKTVGLALVAVLALSAVAATDASAQQGKFTSDGPVTMTATETGVEQNFLEAFGLKIACPGTTYTGHKYTLESETGVPKTHPLIPSGVTTATVTPHYKEAAENCTIKPGPFPGTIDMNGCDYVVHLGGRTVKVGTYTMTLDIVCPPTKTIVITFWKTAADHTTVGKAPFCELHIKPQTNLGGPTLHFTDPGNGHVDVTGAVEKIHIERIGTENSVLCPNAPLTKTDGKYNLDVTTKGHNSSGLATNVSISE
jgi:hypothetical protein